MWIVSFLLAAVNGIQVHRIGAWDLGRQAGCQLNVPAVRECEGGWLIPHTAGVGLWDKARRKWRWRWSKPGLTVVSTVWAQEGLAWIGYPEGWVGLDCESGRVLWERAQANSVWGLPALVKGRLVWVTSSGVVWALEALTGESAWVSGQAQNVSHLWLPAGVQPLGRQTSQGWQVWTLLPSGSLVALEAGSGRLLQTLTWQRDKGAIVSSPLWGPWWWDDRTLWFYDSAIEKVFGVDVESGRWVWEQPSPGRWSHEPERVGSQACIWLVDKGLWCARFGTKGFESGQVVLPADRFGLKGLWRFQVWDVGAGTNRLGFVLISQEEPLIFWGLMQMKPRWDFRILFQEGGFVIPHRLMTWVDGQSVQWWGFSLSQRWVGWRIGGRSWAFGGF